MKIHNTGFSLIELMIVISIIGILSAVAVPAFQAYRIEAANGACLKEANIYARRVYADIQLNKSIANIPAPVAKACSDINNGVKVVTITTFTSRTHSPGNAIISCNLSAGTPCLITTNSP
ncbi:prepilin-type N-terminal cleavage/methylation domain-containing protein [Methylophilus glucosoxydans]|uniref:Prepilin-type N-terminal cleavage/methylation domain-containing protein n=1 Tax=Methylophilus glucosoxydans TaxID=752553 RepID=A0ABW3GG56_9PROT